MLERQMDVTECSDDDVVGCDGGERNGVWEPCDGVADAFASSVAHPDGVTTVGVRSGAKIPPVDCMGVPGTT